MIAHTFEPTHQQSSWIILRGIALKVVVQEAQKEAKKWMISQRPLKVLALSSKILVFLSHHTTHIKARQANYHNTFPLMVLPNSVYEMVIMSHTYRRKPVQMTAHMPTCYFKINQNDAHVLYTGVTRCLGTFTRRKRTSVHYRIVVFAKWWNWPTTHP